MSIARAVWLYCDVPECEWHNMPAFDPPNETAKQARADARGLGWVHRNGQDFCPDHTRPMESCHAGS